MCLQRLATDMNIVCCGLERTHIVCDSLRWVEMNQESFFSMFLRERELKFEASEPEGPVTWAHLGVPGSQGGVGGGQGTCCWCHQVLVRGDT